MSEKAAAKVLDEKDEAFIGFCNVQLLDQDGIGMKTKGSSIQAPLHMVSEAGAGTVVLEALFEPSDPLFYLEVRCEEQYFLMAQMWLDGAKYSEDKALCSMIPVKTMDIKKQMEKTGTANFEGKAQIPVIRNWTKRLCKVTGATEEKKFTTKLSGLRVEIPRDAWMEYKQYRVRLWQSGKNWAGQGDKEDDKDKKKDGEEKEGDDKKMED
mmetsp:Transcript_4893/g.9964  ORF Transcript_4893/g.9964 Transcript_4893/m.9964 type:complete len:210 (+) Transcript_4893:68-697(+)